MQFKARLEDWRGQKMRKYLTSNLVAELFSEDGGG